MSTLPYYSIDITMASNISLIGNKNGTIFDYKNNYKGAMFFNFIEDKTQYKLEMKNLIFKNYEYHGRFQSGVRCISILSIFKDFHISINNCTFINGKSPYISLINDFFIKETVTEPQMKFNNCNFFNNKGRIMEVHHKEEYKYSSIYNNSIIKFNECNFTDNSGLIYSHNSKFIK
ncbi:hypothetical protein BCR36DRAFT_175691 [Piromyces finnis]|uniref:Right handed beta helix domain-containing protein n=1 Tax=Piromyces finnis TaxID=1754191 RepID=A0A1Y1VIT4_9FUNG|nr:hypothetical protein BCR36DRAFT_175691 [Piromyces finnis]|eukprot:ORX56012.1 hypothetical protein BCR36DRAFT_175691 [Piromyces finnis]